MPDAVPDPVVAFTTPRLADRVATVALWLAAALVASVFVWIVGELVIRGLPHLSAGFLVEAPQRAGRAGGIGPVIVSTLLILVVCLAVSIPLGLATAILLSEVAAADRGFGRFVRGSLDVLAGVPSIVFGLFGNAFFCVVLGLGYSILAGGLTLACMVLPILIRSIELGLRSVPERIPPRGGGMAISRSRLLVHVLLPAATPGLAAGLMLGIGRALAETAALLFTSGYVDRMPGTLLDSGRSMSIHIYDLAMNVPGGEPNAYATALVLVGILVVINALAYYLTDRLVAGRGRSR